MVAIEAEKIAYDKVSMERPQIGLVKGIPFMYSAPVVEVNFNYEDYMEGRLSEIQERFPNHDIDCITYYETLPEIEGKDPFSKGITMAFSSKGVVGKPTIFSICGDLHIVSKIVPGQDRDTIYNAFNPENFSDIKYRSYLEVPHKGYRGDYSNIEKLINSWCSSLKKEKGEKADDIFNKLINIRSYNGFANFKYWSITPLRKNPILVICQKVILNYLSQPSVMNP